MLTFTLLAEDPSGARRGRLQSTHGTVETPAFMPVGTAGAVKGCTPDQVLATGAEVVLANTYHLALEGRSDLVKRAGGLHAFMGWPKTILTDSGGFQVFSLPGREVSDQGVRFPSPDGKSVIALDAPRSMALQRDLGADIVMAFDECVGFPAERRVIERSVERTARWAEDCRAFALAKHQALFGIVQGGVELDLRNRSAARITALSFEGFAIGGVSVGEGLEHLKTVVAHTASLLPSDKPRYLMGVGLPEDLLCSIERGMDMFDCVIPTRYARGGTLFTPQGPLRITDKKFRKDRYPIDTACECATCARFSRLYLRHLSYAGEKLFDTLASIHNLHFYQQLMARSRAAIERGDFRAFARDFLARYGSRGASRAPRRPTR